MIINWMFKRMETKEEPLLFATSGTIIKELGRESISNQNVAILELIKNSYDANATKVNLDFENITEGMNAKLEISDDGIGMSYSDLVNKWMKLASTHKKQMSSTKRQIIGQKGIGRLAMESIGNKAELITKSASEKVGFKVEFDWSLYESKEVLINQIQNPLWKFNKKPNEHGTILKISNLRQTWNDQSKLKRLLKDIYLLSPPNSKPKKFKVIPGKGFASVTLKEPNKNFLDSAVYALKARLIGGSNIKYEFSKGNKPSPSKIVTLDKPLSCGDAVFELYFYYLSKPMYERRSNKKIGT